MARGNTRLSGHSRRSGWPRPRMRSQPWGVKYDSAVDCLTKDRDALLAFYDFPAKHWNHLRTSNVVENSFATIRHRTVRSKGCLSNKNRPRNDLQARRGRPEKLAASRVTISYRKIILGVRFRRNR